MISKIIRINLMLTITINMGRFYGYDDGWNQGTGYMNNVNGTNFSVMAHNELMDQQIKENTANLNNLTTQTNIQTGANELRKLGQTAISGYTIKGIEGKYAKMNEAKNFKKSEFMTKGTMRPKDSYKALDKGGDQGARYYSKGGESKWSDIKLDPHDPDIVTGLKQEGVMARQTHFKDIEKGRNVYRGKLDMRDDFFTTESRNTKAFDTPAVSARTPTAPSLELRTSYDVGATGDLTKAKTFQQKLPDESFFNTESGKYNYEIPESHFSIASQDKGLVSARVTKGEGGFTSTKYYAPETHPYFKSAEFGEVGQGTGRGLRTSKGAMSGMGRTAQGIAVEERGIVQAGYKKSIGLARSAGGEIVGKGLRYAGIGASLIGGGIAIQDDISGRWTEFNTAQKWNNGLAIAGSVLEVAGLVTLNPALEGAGGLLTLASGVSGAVGEYQAGEESKAGAKVQTDKINAEAEGSKRAEIKTTTYGTAGVVSAGRYDSRQRLGMAY